MAASKIPRTCETCGKEFLARALDVKNGYARFCSMACRRTSKGSQVPQTCQRCGANFLAWPSQLKKYQPVYCSRKCKNPPLEERFWSRVQKSEGCWVWTAFTDAFGYGTIRANRKGKNKTYGAHIISYELHYNEVPDGMYVLHHCDNPPCVRPDHLFLGTKKDNVRDMVIKGRTTSPLIADQVRQIRTRYAQGGITLKSLGKEFGVSGNAARQIVKRITWTHVV